VSPAFVSPDLVSPRLAPVAAIAGERHLRALGARFEVRLGWRMPVDFGDVAAEARAGREGVALGDRSDLGKLEVHGDADDPETWAAGRWCRVTPRRRLVVTAPERTAAVRDALEAAASRSRGLVSVVDMTAGLAAIAVVGPLARELLARLTALDLRPDRTPVGAVRPGAIARVPAMLLRESEERYLVLAGTSHGEHLWRAASDAGAPLGAAHAGLDALALLEDAGA
jgi:heterotetrameric sarcosine oxidase gamma subunit